MKRIGILSDTHSHLDDAVIKHFSDCDEIWHAGDIGTIELTDRLEQIGTLRAVSGNIDNHTIRATHPYIQRFICEEVDVLIKHIVGYPGRYDKSIFTTLKTNPPKLLIAGHSHILKVMYDKNFNLLFINPGSAGKYGIHRVRTLVKLVIDGEQMKDLEVVELGSR